MRDRAASLLRMAGDDLKRLATEVEGMGTKFVPMRPEQWGKGHAMDVLLRTREIVNERRV